MVDDTTVFTLQLQEGFADVTTLIREDKLSIERFAVIILLCGRADFWENDRTFKYSVQTCLDEIHSRNPTAITVLTATLPGLGDNIRVVRTAGYRNGYLSQLAHEASWLEFSKPGKQLLTPRGPAEDFYDEFYNLNDAGLDVVRRGIEAKVRCAKLLQRTAQSVSN